MRTLLISISCLLTLVSVIPYYRDIAKGKDKPRIATWLIWTILALIGGSASLVDRQIPAGIFTLATAVECGMVVVLGLKHGDHTFEKLDIFCLFAALASLCLWFLFKSPTIGVVVVLIADFIGSIPTFKHCWQKPYEETLLTYLLYVASEIVILSIADFNVFTSFAYPLFYFIEDATLSLFIIFSPNRRSVSLAFEPGNPTVTAKSNNRLINTNKPDKVLPVNNYENLLPPPTGLKVTRQGRNIYLSWDTLPQAISYSIYRNGFFVGSTPMSSFTDYYSSEIPSLYYITAINNHKLESRGSNEVSTVNI